MIHEQNTMKLILKSQAKKLVSNWKASVKADEEEITHGNTTAKEYNPKVVVKFFNPTGIGEWFIFEAKPEDPNILYGLCVLHEAEWGYVSLDELKAFRGQMGLGIERDMYYKPITKMELQERLDKGLPLS